VLHESESVQAFEHFKGVNRVGQAYLERLHEWPDGGEEQTHHPAAISHVFATLHPLSPLCLFADTPIPIGNGAFGLDAAPYRWRVECYSIMTARYQSRARVASPSLFHLTPSLDFIYLLVRLPHLALIFFCAYVLLINLNSR